MTREIVTCAQGTPEWFAARLGIPTASQFSTVMASGKGGGPSVTRRNYMLNLIGERITGLPMMVKTTGAMQRGHEMEPIARAAYAATAEFLGEPVPEEVGFIRIPGVAGASPDGLVGPNGTLEIKSKEPHLHFDCVLRDRIPPDHVDQIQGQLWIAEREWCDFVSYWPNLSLFIKRTYRDEAHIAEIVAAVTTFNEEMAELEATIRSKGTAA